MKYVCLFYGEEAKLGALSGPALEVLQNGCWAYDRKLKEEGHLLHAQPLRPAREARSVRMRRKPKVMDGPFAETKEQLLGFILLDVADQEMAVELAAASPLAAFGTVEVRPAMAHPIFG